MLSEKIKWVPVLNSADVSTGTDCDSINMANYHKAVFLFTFGAVTTDITLTPKSGATEGTKTTAVPTMYAAGGAVIGTAVAGSAASSAKAFERRRQASSSASTITRVSVSTGMKLLSPAQRGTTW